MPVYRLSPVDLAHPDWQASRHRGPALVRAGSEDRARELAHSKFNMGAAKYRDSEGRPTLPASPWPDPARVLAEPVAPAPYLVDGPEGVLEPAEYASSGA